MGLGLIAGALAGAGKGLVDIANQYMQEAEQAKRMAYEKNMLDFRVQVDRENATTAFERQKEMNQSNQEFQVGNTVLASQLAGERDTQNREFQATENQKNRDAQARASAASAGRMSVGEQAQAELLKMKRDYLSLPPGPERDKIAADIKFFEGKTDRSPEYMTVKNELGAEDVYMKTPNGLIRARMGEGQAADSVAPGGPGAAVATRPSMFMKPNTVPSQQMQPSSQAAPINMPVEPRASQVRPGNPDDIGAAKKAGIRDGMMNIQQRMIQTKDVNERLQLAEQYNNLAKMLQQ